MLLKNRAVKKFFSDIFSPYFCVNCFLFHDYGYLCEKCLSETEFSLGIFCMECKRRRPFSENFLKSCCITSVKSLISFVNYENESIAKLIKLGKFEGYFEIFRYLGEIISDELIKIKRAIRDFCLIPIPLSNQDKVRRGFNQSKILCDAISEKLNLKIYECLIKTKINKPQRTLSEKKRFENIKGVFKINYPPPKKIILIDDIKTTGATLLEAADILKSGGAKTIIGLTIIK